ncbi:MAG: alpha-amylase [Candidatus Raymondbacteria bacterium RifOxyA12_full_50_37]|uniref:Alpha-amylase n=1 Tax=Candidatus Raymondbacteria bacterium RIFOXYD12_FULL_49_13 TaxID=1817890 RepID=A0A1F7FJ03_UNCRA|nr:MAG: alpha-amylase [Candidatus Raymondbacteria bacterium RifOxyA12_full_50_37]OGJ86112.1 MAG: alpha-amylase [Candidatus Raymondbacteria bacterium RIFOXYA2_FULL_49_16]OGJ86469.1 MAG: alpha-amylase [Candidatus Raymondbacteria bacterium RifOxyB12_full_50_8]OGJ95988.1 MAG: alpha-amylase [Candidatus Raymondbacteria bacterium RIFOXYC2_FULL_50_21]OGK05612.1 MAG: alpha-amylase [Candidatus Raymondbacteria bacterium RifOxyC12_full_50_8]OGK06446.1 MAG: alpha-amylase [Candidatus Raymondbacteria bacteri
MVNVCFYFQVHQPHRLRNYSFFDIGESHLYHDEAANGSIVRKVAAKCYLPANRLMLDLINRHQGQFRIAYAVSGTAIEQFRKFSPETLDSFRQLAATGCVEFINETYYHSLSFLFSQTEFEDQVAMHRQLIHDEFGQWPSTFRNTELIYNNDLATCIERLGYKTIITEGADRILQWRSPNYVYRPAPCSHLKLLLKNYQLSDDIAFRFSNRGWQEHPLTADKYTKWLHSSNGAGTTINLFMDYETFGEHQWQDTGIFKFLDHLPSQVLSHPDFRFATPGEVSATVAAEGEIDVPDFISWADTERDLSAWTGNAMQKDAMEHIFSLEGAVRETRNPDLIHVWRTLQTSDHFYYMCTKWFSDGDVHKYFNPYGSPYDAYTNYNNAAKDLELSLSREQ